MRSFKSLSIKKRIFLITVLMFFLYLLFSFLGQALFFERFYINHKRNELYKSVDAFSKEYIGLTSDEEINRTIVNYANESNAYIVVMNENGNIAHSMSYEMIAELADGQRIRLSIDNAVRDKSFKNLELQEGDPITISYVAKEIVERNGIYMPVEISTENAVWRMGGGENDGQRPPMSDVGQKTPRAGQEREARMPFVPSENIQTVQATVISIAKPAEETTRNTVDRAESARAAMLWINKLYSGQTMNINERIQYVYENKDTSERYIVVVKKIETADVPQMVFAVATLESVTEAASVMQGVQIVWFIFAVIIVSIVSAVFSNRITAPILNITDVTTKMKDLDFSKKCIVDSDDEVGRLAQNINSMSDSLDRTICELKAANEKLIDDIERERSIEKNRREFVAAVSHELKTPLAIIRAYSEAILDGVSENKKERYIHVIVDETKKMDVLVLDMLENSKLEAGVQKLDVRQHDLCDLAEKIVRRFEQTCMEKEIIMQCKFESQIMQAMFDRDRIEQVITNFITNAIRHTPKGGAVKMLIEKIQDKTQVSIENEGNPIPEDELEKIWDRFYKIDKSRERALGGTGLGLSIAKNILVLHHAEYGVENTKNGVRFWFSL